MSSQIFLVFADDDETLQKELEAHLRPLVSADRVRLSSLRSLSLGAARADEVERALGASRLILLGISASFFVSDDCAFALEKALGLPVTGDRRAASLLLRSCFLEDSAVSKLEALPHDKKPVTEWASRDSAWTHVVGEIAGYLGLAPHKPSPAPPDTGQRDEKAPEEPAKKSSFKLQLELFGMTIHVEPRSFLVRFGDEGPAASAAIGAKMKLVINAPGDAQLKLVHLPPGGGDPVEIPFEDAERIGPSWRVRFPMPGPVGAHTFRAMVTEDDTEIVVCETTCTAT